MAHSKGGLIGKSLMGRADVGPRLLGMVAVNTPFSGSPYARWVPLRSVRAFLPDDEVIAALDPHVPTGRGLPGAHNVRLATPGHFRSLADPELVPLLLRELDRFAARRRRTAQPDAWGRAARSVTPPTPTSSWTAPGAASRGAGPPRPRAAPLPEPSAAAPAA
ncbi:hypothetical protein BCE75_11847 [Isoptericola sp. CG 20/1183]|uniref:Alpha/beta hydrolase family protein n=1 Tax=Isoptericola halotolerans TaxID=300560 RepID=A0ABX5EDM1_9MICO|nr:hypothetical protein BCE75_11847 [Isoptericola sp. CG 20/1183]PRZ03025.1 hypothetical protein BCL65_11647 [Isoptericola halotolerans]